MPANTALLAQGCYGLPVRFVRPFRLATSRLQQPISRALVFPLRLVAWAVGLFELVAAALILIGLKTRIAALLLAAFSFTAGFIGHYGQGGEDPTLAFMHSQALMKDIAIAGGLSWRWRSPGAGGWSVDRHEMARSAS